LCIEERQHIGSPDFCGGGTESPMAILLALAEGGIDLRLKVLVLLVGFLAH
jgi:hypothetical protein